LRWSLLIEFSCLYPSVNTDRKIPVVYTVRMMKGITVEFNKTNHMVTWYFTDIIILSVMSLVILNLWPHDRPFSPPPSFLIFPYAFCSFNKQLPLSSQISTQFNPQQQIWPPKYLVCQHPYFNSNFIEDSLL